MAEYRGGGITMSSQTERTLGNVRGGQDFFSDDNVEFLHKAIVQKVHQRTGGQAKIDRQSDQDLRALMVELHDPRLPLERQNGITIERCADIVINNIASYLGYVSHLADQQRENTLMQIIGRPESTRTPRKETAGRPVF